MMFLNSNTINCHCFQTSTNHLKCCSIESWFINFFVKTNIWFLGFFQVIIHNITVVTQKVQKEISQMQSFFTQSSKSYYGDPLFLLSIVLHRVIPIDKVIMLDVDLKFNDDIQLLFEISMSFQSRISLA